MANDENLPYGDHEVEYDEFEEHEITKPAARPFYKRRKYWIFCAILTVVIVAIAVPVALFVILPKVAQSIVNQSKLSFNSIQITEPTNTTMKMALNGALNDAGPFHATVSYPVPIQVFYQGQKLGEMTDMPQTEASGGKGSIEGTASFTVTDEAAFSSFSKDMLGQKSFVWNLRGKVEIRAMGRTVSDLDLSKDIEMLGMNGFPEVNILKFDLPGDAPNGQGINLVIDTSMNNPSPIGVDLGTIVLDISYNGTRLGQVRANNAALTGQSPSVLNLTGIMEPLTNPEDLEKVGGLFSAYLAGLPSDTQAKGVAVLPDGVNRVSWLSAGLEAMTLNVKLQSPIPVNIIKSIALGPMTMNWTNADAYAPIANSPQVTAGFEMPFGFTVNVTQVQNNMTVVYNNKSIAQVNVAEWGAAVTTKDTTGSFINFALPPSPFAINADSHGDFDAFVKDLTVGSSQAFGVQGTAGTIAQTPIGPVKITGIPFKSDVSLTGLQGLSTEPTVIHNLTVIGGIKEGLQIALDLTMTNPSDMTIATGPGANGIVTFNMVYQGDNVGTVIFDDLTLVPGANSRQAGALFTPTGTAGGQALLQMYMTNQVATVDVQGSSSSSAIAPLANGLKEIQIQSDMPGNPAKLVLGTSLTILNDTTSTGVALASVTVNNPFLPQLTIKSILSTVKYQDKALGSLDIPEMTFVVPGVSQAVTPGLPLTMDLSIDSLLGLMISQAQVNNMNTAPLLALAQMVKDPTFKPDPAVFVGFNLPAFVKQAMQGLLVDVEMSVNVLVGEYATSLTLTQKAVPTATDDTILKLLPIVGTPLAQGIVDRAEMSFEAVMINSPAETAFNTDISGMIANTGPFDAQIAFPEGSSVSWANGENVLKIGQIAMPTLSAQANVGARLDLKAVPFAVADPTAMAQFVGYSLASESFEWEITATNMVIVAMGAPIPHINMKKRVTLKGFNGLQGLAIEKFDLPSNDPDGIHIVLSATLPNPSNVGIELGTVAFANVYQGQELGFVQTTGMKLLPSSISPVAMEGTMTRQTTEAGLNALGNLFRETLNGGAPMLEVRGKSVTPPSGPVSWLSAAFGHLALNVTLPSIGKQEIITGVSIKTMTLDFTQGDAYAPITSSDNIEATYKMPFTFPLNVSAVGQDIALQLPQGEDVAHLSFPISPASTIGPNTLRTGYTDQPLKVVDSAHEKFAQFNYILTTSPGIGFFLSGTADTVADTAAGAVTIPGVPVAVGTQLAGMNLNAGGANITDIKVVGGTPQYLEINQAVGLKNPSGITVKMGQVSFTVKTHGVPIGKAIVDNMILVPGDNALPAVFRLQPPSPELRDQFLSGFVAGASFALDIEGGADSTTIEPLKMAMAGVKMSAGITGINERLVADGSASQPQLGEMMQILRPRKTPVQVMIYNPFDAPLTIKKIFAKNIWSGIEFGVIDTQPGELGTFVVPAKSTRLTPTLTMVSPAGFGFLGTILKFTGSNPDLIKGEKVNVPFDIESVIVTSVGEGEGYTGNVAYAQKNTPITVQIGGKPPAEVPLVRQGQTSLTPSPQETTTAPQETPTATQEVPTTTEAPTAPQETPATPEQTPVTPEETPATPEEPPVVVAKRQDIGPIAPGTEVVKLPGDGASEEEIMRYLYAYANYLAVLDGQPAPFAL
ncbi:hypothetical protein DFQ27_001190 [Actinomortierella ambigua]|uniref:Uncharacterized protein n=1 Tax=Actinomortierella ambigua TaxID=1343610 RepID=A0A9P6QEJ2_9FUNG|nr:hypothetical protein DFQ27_001190 [Actinomortierella ambigua]